MTEPTSLEQALERLEAVTAELERGDADLEASLAAFEEGVKLVHWCTERLRAAELRVAELEASGGELTERPWDAKETS